MQRVISCVHPTSSVGFQKKIDELTNKGLQNLLQVNDQLFYKLISNGYSARTHNIVRIYGRSMLLSTSPTIIVIYGKAHFRVFFFAQQKVHDKNKLPARPKHTPAVRATYLQRRSSAASANKEVIRGHLVGVAAAAARCICRCSAIHESSQLQLAAAAAATGGPAGRPAAGQRGKGWRPPAAAWTARSMSCCE